jgi:hypothetical protein
MPTLVRHAVEARPTEDELSLIGPTPMPNARANNPRKTRLKSRRNLADAAGSIVARYALTHPTGEPLMCPPTRAEQARGHISLVAYPDQDSALSAWQAFKLLRADTPPQVAQPCERGHQLEAHYHLVGIR